MKFLIPLFLFFSITLVAQQEGGFDVESERRETGFERDTGAFVELIDTTPIEFFHAKNPYVFQFFKDTAIARFHQYDPALSNDFGHLGNLGSAHHSLLFRNPEVKQLRMGYHQFDAYKFRISEHQFYKLNTALTDVFYSQGNTQEDAYFKARFARNFSDGIQLSLNYAKVNQMGNYTHQRVVNTNLSIGLWFQNQKGNWNSFLTFASNVVTQNDNGGIQTDELFDSTFSEIRTSIPVQSTTANTRYQDIAYSWTNQLDLFKKDSVIQKRKTLLEHKLEFTNRFYKAIEGSADSD
ncbi:MAG: putative porin, partial [Bacteroidota bacterium]